MAEDRRRYNTANAGGSGAQEHTSTEGQTQARTRIHGGGEEEKLQRETL